MKKPVDGSQKVLASGRVALSPVKADVFHADIQAALTNAGDVYVGGELVSAETLDNRGTRLKPGAILSLDNTDLQLWWLVGAVPGDYVFWGGQVDE